MVTIWNSLENNIMNFGNLKNLNFTVHQKSLNYWAAWPNIYVLILFVFLFYDTLRHDDEYLSALENWQKTASLI